MHLLYTTTREGGGGELTKQDYQETAKLFRRFKNTNDQKLRDQLVLAHMNLVRYLAAKFANRGVALEDLVQVGTIGLINAIDRYDPDRGIQFSTYATPTIVGEIRRYFRDKGWALKVPRRLLELNRAAGKVMEELTQQLGRSPTIQEITEAVGASEEETLEAIELGNAYETVSLDTKIYCESNGPLSLTEFIGALDPVLEAAEKYGDLWAAMDRLDPRKRQIIMCYYFEGMSQTKIAERLNISQMHVSRLHAKALSLLKAVMEGLLEDATKKVRARDASGRYAGKVVVSAVKAVVSDLSVVEKSAVEVKSENRNERGVTGNMSDEKIGSSQNGLSVEAERPHVAGLLQMTAKVGLAAYIMFERDEVHSTESVAKMIGCMPEAVIRCERELNKAGVLIWDNDTQNFVAGNPNVYVTKRHKSLKELEVEGHVFATDGGYLNLAQAAKEYVAIGLTGGTSPISAAPTGEAPAGENHDKVAAEPAALSEATTPPSPARTGEPVSIGPKEARLAVLVYAESLQGGWDRDRVCKALDSPSCSAYASLTHNLTHKRVIIGDGKGKFRPGEAVVCLVKLWGVQNSLEVDGVRFELEDGKLNLPEAAEEYIRQKTGGSEPSVVPAQSLVQESIPEPVAVPIQESGAVSLDESIRKCEAAIAERETAIGKLVMTIEDHRAAIRRHKTGIIECNAAIDENNAAIEAIYRKLEVLQLARGICEDLVDAAK